jgi:hypothetical protein
MTNQINAVVGFPIGTWVEHSYFHDIPKMLVVKHLENGWIGTRYQAQNLVLVYGEYSLDELEPFEDDPEDVEEEKRLRDLINFQ